MTLDDLTSGGLPVNQSLRSALKSSYLSFQMIFKSQLCHLEIKSIMQHCWMQ